MNLRTSLIKENAQLKEENRQLTATIQKSQLAFPESPAHKPELEDPVSFIEIDRKGGLADEELDEEQQIILFFDDDTYEIFTYLNDDPFFDTVHYIPVGSDKRWIATHYSLFNPVPPVKTSE